MSTKWIALFGNIKIEKNIIKHVPYKFTDEQNKEQFGSTVAKSNLFFENGEIKFEVYLKDPKSRCQVILNQGRQTELYVGINVWNNTYGFGIFKDKKWENYFGVGFGKEPETKEWLQVKIKVTGSLIELYVNDIKLSEANENIYNSQIALLMSGTEEVSVRNLSVKTAKPKAFIVMQFTDEFNMLFSEVIKPTCVSYGFECIRADNIYSNGLIIGDITKSIKEATVIIADITPNNANVYYEVGYAHGIGKPTILLSDKKREALPFDLAGFRTLFYDNTIGGKTIVEERLKNHLDNLAL